MIIGSICIAHVRTGIPVCLALVVHFRGSIVLCEQDPLTFVKQLEYWYIVAFISAPVKFGIEVAGNVLKPFLSTPMIDISRCYGIRLLSTHRSR